MIICATLASFYYLPARQNSHIVPPIFSIALKIIHFPRRWRTLSPLNFTTRHISCATLLESVRNGNKICIPVPLRAQKEEKTSFLVRSGNKTAISFPLRHLHFQLHHSSWRSGHSPGTLTPILRPSEGGRCSR